MSTRIRQLVKEQSFHGFHRLPFGLHLLDALLYGKYIFKILEQLQQCFWKPIFFSEFL